MSDITNAQALADIFLQARHDKTALETIPPFLVPTREDQAYRTQDLVARALTPELGPVLGWKVGAATPEAEPFGAPIHRNTIFTDKSVIPADLCHVFGAEAEIAYRFGQDLPAHDAAWTQDEVFAAIATIHPAIEIVDTRFAKFGSQDRLTHLADQGNHGAMVIGEGLPNWRDFTPTSLPMTMTINGEIAYQKRGGNSAGDPLRLLVWLANHASRHGYGIAKGTTIITGSTMGSHFVEPGAKIRVEFEGLPSVETSISTVK